MEKKGHPKEKKNAARLAVKIVVNRTVLGVSVRSYSLESLSEGYIWENHYELLHQQDN